MTTLFWKIFLEKIVLIFKRRHIMYKIYEYPKCTTCKRALKFLKDNNIEFTDINLVEKTPTQKELSSIYKKSGLPIKKLLNTSGKKYKELNLKDKINEMTEEEILKLLSSDGMLIKRPIITDGKKVLIGFKEDEWSSL
jgi:arsenate reductase